MCVNIEEFDDFLAIIVDKVLSDIDSNGSPKWYSFGHVDKSQYTIQDHLPM